MVSFVPDPAALERRWRRLTSVGQRSASLRASLKRWASHLQGSTPEDHAAAHAESLWSRRLLDSGADPEQRTPKEELTLLHWTTEQNLPDMTLLLIEYGADPERPARGACSPLDTWRQRQAYAPAAERAALQAHIDRATAARAFALQQGREQPTLHQAALDQETRSSSSPPTSRRETLSHDERRLRRLTTPEALNRALRSSLKTWRTSNALEISIEPSSEMAWTRRLLEAGADVTQPRPGSGLTLCHDAAQHNLMDMLLLLIEFGADPHRLDFGRHPASALDLFRTQARLNPIHRETYEAWVEQASMARETWLLRQAAPSTFEPATPRPRL